MQYPLASLNSVVEDSHVSDALKRTSAIGPTPNCTGLATMAATRIRVEFSDASLEAC